MQMLGFGADPSGQEHESRTSRTSLVWGKERDDQMPKKTKSTKSTKTTRKPVTVKKDPDAAESAKGQEEDSGVFAKLAKKAGKGAAKGAAKELLK